MTIHEPEFGGVIGRTYQESQPWWPEPVFPPQDAPNVVVILLDDTGFSQLGCYGSSIDTPNMDRLAANGLRYNDFHTTALCSPTRASLLTGRNPHSVGMRMLSVIDIGYPNSRGRIPPNAATIAEMLKGAGYNTFALGKWHLGNSDNNTGAGPFDDWPLGKGFERYYGFLEGSTDQFYPELLHDNHKIDPPRTPEEGYHLSEDLVDQAVSMIANQQSGIPEKPFFLYLAFGATHSAHQAPDEYLEKYRGKFDQGWDQEREKWFARQKELGIVPPEAELAPRNPGVNPWDSLSEEEQRVSARLQEAFAAMLDHTDAQIGRLLDFLESIEIMDNTLIILLSDNGASQEGGPHGTVNETRTYNQIPPDKDYDLAHIDEIGTWRSNTNYPQGWAQVGNTPLKWYKQNVHEGGIRDPLIIHWPKRIQQKGAVCSQYHHVTDIVPTILEATGVKAPDVYKGVQQKPVEGISMAYTFDNVTAPTQKDVQYYEMFGERGIWHQGWKAVCHHKKGDSYDDEQWELYHTDEDFAEIHDLAAERPEKLRQMIERWWTEAGKYGVLPLDDRKKELFAIKFPKRIGPHNRSEYVFYPGMARLERGTAPNTRNRSYEIIAEVDRPAADSEGVLIAYGDHSSGYSLFVKDGRLVHDYNYVGEHTILESDVEVPTGPSRLRFAFTQTGRLQGIGRLYIDDEQVGEAEIPNTLPLRISKEGLDVGRDSLSPVSEMYDPPFDFSGVLKKVIIRLDTDKEPDHDGDFKVAMGEQ